MGSMSTRSRLSTGSISSGGLGSELVSNGSFTGAAAEWSAGFNWALNGDGVATGTNVSAGNAVNQVIAAIVAGETYQSVFEIKSSNGDGIRPYLGGAFGAINRSAVDTYTEDIVAVAGTNCGVGGQAGEAWTGTIDNVSIKKKTSTVLK